MSTTPPPIMNGAITNGTYHIGAYDPTLPVPYWHQNMELATVCVTNSLTLIIIVARIWYRWAKIKHFRYDDGWMAIAGLFMLPYFASQLGTIYYGSGLHSENVPKPHRRMHWHFTPGWAGYYIVASCIKLSVCSCFTEILPQHLKKLRYTAYGLCFLIASLGATMTFSWLFQCTPVLSNFLWSIESDYCVNYDIFRWMWIGFSLPIDVVILIIPAQMLKRTQLREHERKILKLVFSATLLGTITCAIGIYGVYETRVDVQLDGFYQEVPFIMMNDIEIFMYAMGASFPVLSRYLVSKSSVGSRTTTSPSTLGRRFPYFNVLRFSDSTRHTSQRSNAQLDPRSSAKSLQQSEYSSSGVHDRLAPYERKYQMNELEPKILAITSQRDLERG